MVVEDGAELGDEVVECLGVLGDVDGFLEDARRAPDVYGEDDGFDRSEVAYRVANPRGDIGAGRIEAVERCVAVELVVDLALAGEAILG